MYKLVNTCQNYLWGKKGAESFVYKFFKAQQDASAVPKEDQTYAEYWMGCHPKSFSHVIVNDQKVPLAAFLKEKHAEELPYLFKVLSIQSCLSLQSHPTKELAKQLHAKDPANYPDENHKPEMAVTLTDFLAFCNFCPKAELIANFKKYNCVYSKLKTYVDKMEAAPTKEETKAAFKELFMAINQLPKETISELKTEITTVQPQTIRETVLKDIIETYPDDLSVVTTLAFNILELKPGQAFVMNPHEPHSYIKGEILEVMALSDNVVRLGLTPKFKDYDTMLGMLTWDMSKKDLVAPIVSQTHGLTYTVYRPKDYEEFQCIVITGQIEQGRHGQFHAGFHGIVANFGPKTSFKYSGDSVLNLEQFETAFVTKHENVQFTCEGEVFLVICTKNTEVAFTGPSHN